MKGDCSHPNRALTQEGEHDYLARGEIEQAVEWSGKAIEHRFPAIIPRLIRAFEPSLRRSAAWPGVLKNMNLA